MGGGIKRKNVRRVSLELVDKNCFSVLSVVRLFGPLSMLKISESTEISFRAAQRAVTKLKRQGKVETKGKSVFISPSLDNQLPERTMPSSESTKERDEEFQS